MSRPGETRALIEPLLRAGMRPIEAAAHLGITRQRACQLRQELRIERVIPPPAPALDAVLHVAISTAEKATVDEAATRAGVSTAEFVRRAIRETIAKA